MNKKENFTGAPCFLNGGLGVLVSRLRLNSAVVNWT